MWRQVRVRLTAPIGAHGTAVVKADQNPLAGRYHLVRFSALDFGDEAHAARVMLVCWIVQPLTFRSSNTTPLF